MSHPQHSNRRPARRGSTYIIVLGTALVVTVLGLSALMVQRIQRNESQHASHVVEARLYADAALRIGMLRIENDPDWRYTYSDGVWEVNRLVGDGVYTLIGLDPSDRELSDGATDPLTLIGVGKRGSAVQKVEITLVPEYRGYSCLESVIHAGADVSFIDATVKCDHTISANGSVDASNSAVGCDVAAVNTVTGSTYNAGTQVGMEPLELPDPNTVFDYYFANGTWIDLASLPLGFANLLRNPDLEAGTKDWAPWGPSPGNPGCVISSDLIEYHTGAASLAVTQRDTYQAGPTQDIAATVRSGVTYDCLAWVKMKTSEAKVRFVMEVNSSVEGAQRWTSGDTLVQVGDGWKLLAMTLTPTFTGVVTSATLKIETDADDSVDDFYIDDVVFKETGAERTISQTVLSPTSNPFGAKTNPQGIYLIDVAGREIYIKDCRIVGTLVLISPGAASRVGHVGALNWRPAVSGLPALLVKDSAITINPLTIGLVESATNANFNPLGTSYDDLGDDSDKDDTYPSEIQGMIYSTHTITFRWSPVVTGAIISNDNIKLYGTMDMTHDPSYLASPPPGFNGPEEIKILLDSARKQPH